MWKYSISYPSIKNYLLQLSSQDEICLNGHIFKEPFYSTICYISTIKDKLTCIYTWLIISSFSATWILTFLTPGSKGVSLASLFSLRFWNNKLLNDSLVAFEMCHDFKIDYILPSENLLGHLFVIPVQNVFSIYRL